jgi:hypothetical protein
MNRLPLLAELSPNLELARTHLGHEQIVQRVVFELAEDRRPHHARSARELLVMRDYLRLSNTSRSETPDKTRRQLRGNPELICPVTDGAAVTRPEAPCRRSPEQR